MRQGSGPNGKVRNQAENRCLTVGVTAHVLLMDSSKTPNVPAPGLDELARALSDCDAVNPLTDAEWFHTKNVLACSYWRRAVALLPLLAAARNAAFDEAAAIADSFGGPDWGIALAIRAAKTTAATVCPECEGKGFTDILISDPTGSPITVERWSCTSCATAHVDGTLNNA